MPFVYGINKVHSKERNYLQFVVFIRRDKTLLETVLSDTEVTCKDSHFGQGQVKFHAETQGM